MRSIRPLISLLAIVTICQVSFAQGESQSFKMAGNNPATIEINKSFTTSGEVYQFDKNVNKIFGLAISADIKLSDNNSKVTILFTDENGNEYLVYDAYLLKNGKNIFSVENVAEETAILKEGKAKTVRIEITGAEVYIKNLTYSKGIGQGIDMDKVMKEKKQAQNLEKIDRINKNLKAQGLGWVAGPTEVAELSYTQRKKLYGQSTFPAGFEYYAGGVISAGTTEQLKSAAASMYVEDWDWRNRHGKNWITPVTNQGSCGSCWAFAATGATEAMVNVFFNQQLNLNLAEQDVLSCSGAGDCGGGYPSSALNYISSTGVVDEAAFPYSGTYLPCANKSASPAQLIKIGGKIDFGTSLYPTTEDDLKRMLIQMGPVSGGLYDWSHAMVLVGYKVVKEGDYFYYRDLSLNRSWKTVAAGDPLIGKIVWIFKNSWGPYFGDAGYVYVETPISNIGWTHGIKTPLTSKTNIQVICQDNDQDGYYWWGIGSKPANCPASPAVADGNDADPTLGPLDQYGFCLPLGQALKPVANFSASNTTITAGQSVAFNDLSTNSPTSWSWSFPGGNPTISNVQNPIITYSAPGNYSITLTATNSSGSDAETKTDYIVVTTAALPPVADFLADNTVITKGSTINFSDKSINNPTAWEWSITGASTTSSTVKNPSVKFDIAGTYDVILKVSNAGGNDLKTVLKYITVTEPQPPPPVAYCIPSGWNSSVNYISNVAVSNGINNPTLGNGFTIYNGKTMVPGKSYTLSMTPKNLTARYYWRVWIDYNGDGDFFDAGETVLSGANKRGTFKGTITVPVTANSKIRARVAMKTLSYPLACENNQVGEVEDYEIAIGAATSKTKSAFAKESLSEDVRLILYPNPADRIININLTSYQSGNIYSVYRTNGQKMTTGKLTSGTTSFSVADYPSGIYIVEVVSNNNTFIEKFIRK